MPKQNLPITQYFLTENFPNPGVRNNTQLRLVRRKYVEKHFFFQSLAIPRSQKYNGQYSEHRISNSRNLPIYTNITLNYCFEESIYSKYYNTEIVKK